MDLSWPFKLQPNMQQDMHHDTIRPQDAHNMLQILLTGIMTLLH